MRSIFILPFISLLVVEGVNSQAQQRQMPAANAGVNPPMMPAGNQKPGPKSFSEVITAKAKTAKGLFTVHRIEDKTYFEIPDSVLGRDILVESRLSKAAADMRSSQSMAGYAGDELNTSVVRFEKGPNNRIFVRELSYAERSDSTGAMFRSVQNSTVQPIALSFDVKAYNKDSVTGVKSTLIEMTDLLNGDNDLFFFGPSKSYFKVGMYQADKSYLADIKTFPINTEITTVKTYSRVAPPGLSAMMGGQAPTGVFTVEVNTSLVLLAKTPVRPRFFDPRVGYFTEGYTDFDANPQGIKQLTMVARWNLEPRDEDIEKYKRGELVEPKKPIVIYIDPATPAKWVPYLIQGVNDWQAAFEKAGFKNAIMAKVAPTEKEDSTWSLYDARHSAIVYKPSAVANASGPHTVDPRSGEIIETHINWYHNVMKLIHDWYMVQAAPLDKRARKMQFDDELMGQLIRFVSSHEVGHTLGLRHNFGASSATPVEKLRDKKWVEANGHTSSIMDYARFNYVAQPEDSIGAAGIFPRIGDYDNWAIEWGYRWFDDKTTATEEKATLNKMTIEKLKDKKYWFGTEMDGDDPRAQSEDLGDNAMKASEYGIKNLKRVLNQLPEWTKEENEGYDNLKGMYSQLFQQLARYVGHVSKNIGGRYETIKTVEQQGPVYEPVAAATQKEAMSFLAKNIFTTPTWLIDRKILDLIGGSAPVIVLNLQKVALTRLLDAGTFNKIIVADAQYPNAYKVMDYCKDLENAIWTELKEKKPIDLYRRNLQKEYVSRLSDILHPPAAAGNQMGQRPMGGTANYDNTDVVSVVRAHLASLKTSIQAAIPLESDTMTKYHLQDIVARISESLKPGKGE